MLMLMRCDCCGVAVFSESGEMTISMGCGEDGVVVIEELVALMFMRLVRSGVSLLKDSGLIAMSRRWTGGGVMIIAKMGSKAGRVVLRLTIGIAIERRPGFVGVMKLLSSTCLEGEPVAGAALVFLGVAEDGRESLSRTPPDEESESVHE